MNHNSTLYFSFKSLITEYNSIKFWYDQILINTGTCAVCPEPTSMSSSIWSSFAMASSLSDPSVSCVGWPRPNSDEFEFLYTLKHTHFYLFSLLTAFLLVLVLATIFLSDLWTLELPKKDITEVGVCFGGVGPIFGEMVGWELFAPPFDMVFGDLVGDLLDETFTSFAFPDSFLPLAVPFSFGFVFFRVINVSSESGKIKRGQKKSINYYLYVILMDWQHYIIHVDICLLTPSPESDTKVTGCFFTVAASVSLVPFLVFFFSFFFSSSESEIRWERRTSKNSLTLSSV